MYKSTELEINKLLAIVLQKNASDLHLVAGKPPTIRIDSRLTELKEYDVLSGAAIAAIVEVLLGDDVRRKQFKENLELDFSYAYKDNVRFRVNVYMQKGYVAAALRLIASSIQTVEELNLPEQLLKFTDYKQGLVLVVGPTGHGKSTTLAALIDRINHSREENILTIEDPIEYVYIADKSLINQREVGQDTKSFGRALRSALREDPNVILVGEMRDYESIATTITLAETGHLVFATLHTNDAAQTIDRIIDVFPAYQQNQTRSQLSTILLGVISQRLLPKIGGGRLPAVEIMINSNAVSNVIREGKTYELPNIINTSATQGMISLDRSLAAMVQKNLITREDALLFAADPDSLRGLIGGS
ncbi:MAG TPA: type IV pilus twitching motility protein PilT [Patescibacteria group bacterium]|nr:type IV pilus twitching motility protein PilT [Patescibacteria group bacterium]